MFAIVAAGRLPQAQPMQVDQTHIVFPIEAAEAVNHLVVFMDGSQPFPPGYAATVHFLWPGQNAQWMLLGWCVTLHTLYPPLRFPTAHKRSPC